MSFKYFSYYKCEGDNPVRKICDSGLWFNIEQDRCTNAYSVKCTKHALITPRNPNYAEDIYNYVDIGAYNCRFSYFDSPISTATYKPDNTTLPSNIGSCHIKKDLFDDGVYLKSVCIYRQGANYDDGFKLCKDNNMNLFIINNKSVETQFYNAVMDLVGK